MSKNRKTKLLYAGRPLPAKPTNRLPAAPSKLFAELMRRRLASKTETPITPLRVASAAPITPTPKAPRHPKEPPPLPAVKRSGMVVDALPKKAVGPPALPQVPAAGRQLIDEADDGEPDVGGQREGWTEAQTLLMLPVLPVWMECGTDEERSEVVRGMFEKMVAELGEQDWDEDEMLEGIEDWFKQSSRPTPTHAGKVTWTRSSAMEVLLKRSILDECARLSGVNKGPQFIAAYSKARKDVYERLSSQEKKQLEDLIVRWNHDGPPPLVQQKLKAKTMVKDLTDFAMSVWKKYGTLLHIIVSHKDSDGAHLIETVEGCTMLPGVTPISTGETNEKLWLPVYQLLREQTRPFLGFTDRDTNERDAIVRSRSRRRPELDLELDASGLPLLPERPEDLSKLTKQFRSDLMRTISHVTYRAASGYPRAVTPWLSIGLDLDSFVDPKMGYLPDGAVWKDPHGMKEQEQIAILKHWYDRSDDGLVFFRYTGVLSKDRKTITPAEYPSQSSPADRNSGPALKPGRVKTVKTLAQRGAPKSPVFANPPRKSKQPNTEKDVAAKPPPPAPSGVEAAVTNAAPDTTHRYREEYAARREEIYKKNSCYSFGKAPSQSNSSAEARSAFLHSLWNSDDYRYVVKYLREKIDPRQFNPEFAKFPPQIPDMEGWTGLSPHLGENYHVHEGTYHELLRWMSDSPWIEPSRGLLRWSKEPECMERLMLFMGLVARDYLFSHRWNDLVQLKLVNRDRRPNYLKESIWQPGLMEELNYQIGNIAGLVKNNVEVDLYAIQAGMDGSSNDRSAEQRAESVRGDDDGDRSAEQRAESVRGDHDGDRSAEQRAESVRGDDDGDETEFADFSGFGQSPAKEDEGDESDEDDCDDDLDEWEGIGSDPEVNETMGEPQPVIPLRRAIKGLPKRPPGIPVALVRNLGVKLVSPVHTPPAALLAPIQEHPVHAPTPSPTHPVHFDLNAAPHLAADVDDDGQYPSTSPPPPLDHHLSSPPPPLDHHLSSPPPPLDEHLPPRSPTLSADGIAIANKSTSLPSSPLAGHAGNMPSQALNLRAPIARRLPVTTAPPRLAIPPASDLDIRRRSPRKRVPAVHPDGRIVHAFDSASRGSSIPASTPPVAKRTRSKTKPQDTGSRLTAGTGKPAAAGRRMQTRRK